MVDWLDIILSLLGNGLIMGLVLTLLRSHLESRNTIELAHLNSQLSRLETEYTTRLTELHRRRADAIAHLYKLLASAERKLKYVGLPLPRIEGEETDPWKRAMPARTVVAEMVEFYEDNRVLFTPSQIALMEGITEVFKKLQLRAYLSDASREDPEADDDIKQMWREALKEAKTIFEMTYPNLKEQLESDFRKIMGLEEDSPQKAEKS